MIATVSTPEQVIAALDEAVRGENGLQKSLVKLSDEVDNLKNFRSTVIGVVLTVNILAPVFWHYILK